jgi:Outer membrane lipoprotein-sorting protein
MLCLAGGVLAPAQNEGPPPTAQRIVERMAQARAHNRALFRPYVVTRDYKLFGRERDEATSEVSAEVTFVPPNSKKYSILERSGSGLGERLVRRILDGETAIVKDFDSTDISAANYDFRFAREERLNGRLCYVLDLLPKRPDRTLLRGNVWVDADTFLLHRLEGEPMKSPSWWLRNSRITFFYGDVEGMWLQTASEFTTYVRIFGQHTMISRDVKYETAAQRASTGWQSTNSLSQSVRPLAQRP